MNTHETFEEDRYRGRTDRIRNKLIDGVEKILGGSEQFQERFKMSPGVARSSRDISTRLFTIWGSLYCNSAVTGSTITKAFIDNMKVVTSAREKEMALHQSQPNPTPEVKASNIRHEHFINRFKDLTRMFEEAELRYHPAAVKPPTLPVLENALVSPDIGSESDGISSSDSDIRQSQVDGESLIETALPEQIDSEDFTQAEIDGKNDPSLDAFCETTGRIKNEVFHTWTQFLDGRATFARAAVVSNFAIHLAESQANEWHFSELDKHGKRRSKTEDQPRAADLLVALPAQRRKEKEARQKLEGVTKTERALAEFEAAKRYSDPVASILVEHKTGTIDFLYRHHLQSQSDLPRYGDNLQMGGHGDVIKLYASKALLIEKYDYHLRGTQAVIFLREFVNLRLADATRDSPCYPVTDILTRSATGGPRNDGFNAQDAVALDWLLSVNRLRENAKKDPYAPAQRLAQTFKKSLLNLSDKDRKRVATDLDSALKIADALLENVAQDLHEKPGPVDDATAEPPFLLKHQHFLSSTLSFRLLFLVRSSIAKLEEITPRILCTVHLYNMARTVAGMEIIWEELELLIQLLGVKNLFGRNTLPTTWPEIHRALEWVRRDKDGRTYLRPSELLTILNEHTLDPATYSLRKIQRYIIRSNVEVRPSQTADAGNLEPSIALDLSAADKEKVSAYQQCVANAKASTHKSTPAVAQNATPDPSPENMISQLSELVAREEELLYHNLASIRERWGPMMLDAAELARVLCFPGQQATDTPKPLAIFDLLAADESKRDFVHAVLRESLANVIEHANERYKETSNNEEDF